jgi:hypothetical protein
MPIGLKPRAFLSKVLSSAVHLQSLGMLKDYFRSLYIQFRPSKDCRRLLLAMKVLEITSWHEMIADAGK